MIYRCGRCGNVSNIKTAFKIAPIDAIGFVFLFAVSLMPVYLVSFIIAMIVTVGETDQGGFIQKTALWVVTLLYFFMFGGKVAHFISLFVDYKLTFKLYCKKCGDVFLLKEYPKDTDRPFI